MTPYIVRHLIISFRIVRTWFVSFFIFLLPVASFIGIAFLWLKLSIPLQLFLIFNASCALIALCVGWATAQPMSIRAYKRAIKKAYTDSMRYCYPDTEPLTGRNEPGANLLILGQPGTGKTKELEKYLYTYRGKQIPILLQMKYYDGFLSRYAQAGGASGQTRPSNTLMDYLLANNDVEINQYNRTITRNELVGIQHLRAFLPLLAQKKRIIFLCDGLNELAPQSLIVVCQELRQIMQAKQNKVIMTCRELDYREMSLLRQFELEGLVHLETIPLLTHDRVEGFTRYYLSNKYNRERKRQVDDQLVVSRVNIVTDTSLRYDYASPFILITLIETLARPEQVAINSRGRLLQEAMTLRLKEQQIESAKIEEVRLLLGALACTARRNDQRNAIQLGRGDRAISPKALAQAANKWLDKYRAADDIFKAIDRDKVAGYLEIALNAEIISISRNGVLSFKHELIAEYFVAEYLLAVYKEKKIKSIPFWEYMFRNKEAVGAWSEPVALWAGLVDNPMQLAGFMVEWVEGHNQNLANIVALPSDSNAPHPIEPFYVLMISLACVGVVWSTMTNPTASNNQLHQSVQSLLEKYVVSEESRAKIAPVIRRCADEGGIEVYRSFLSRLSTTPGLEDLLLHPAFDKHVITDLHFGYLKDIVERPYFKREVDAITRLLGREGEIVIDQTKIFSEPGNSTSLRVAAITILGQVKSVRIVELLIPYLTESQREIYESTVRALTNLGPQYTMDYLEQFLQDQKSDFQTWLILMVFDGFAKQHDQFYHERIVSAAIPFLSDKHRNEIQEKATNIILRVVKMAANPNGIPENGNFSKKRNHAADQVFMALKTDDLRIAKNLQRILYEASTGMTDYIITYFEDQHPPFVVRTRLIDVLGDAGDVKALPFLLERLGDEPPQLQIHTSAALVKYGAKSVAALIGQVKSPLNGNAIVAQRAASILVTIGASSVIPVCKALSSDQERGTTLLVHILFHLKDPRSIPYLIRLLPQVAPNYRQLTCSVLRLLSNFHDPQVVKPLIDFLESQEIEFVETAIQGLGKLGEVALDDLIHELDIDQERTTTPYVRRAIAAMRQLKEERLLNQFAKRDALARQIKEVFKERAYTSSSFVVSNLFHTNERIRDYVRRTLKEMDPAVTVEPLINYLNYAEWRPKIREYLLLYPTSIPLLLQKLDSGPINDAAYEILQMFDSKLVLPWLIVGLQDEQTTQQTSRLIVDMVGNTPALLSEIIGLFDPSKSYLSTLSSKTPEALREVREALSQDRRITDLPSKAQKALQELLAQELAEVSLDKLIKALADGKLVNYCSDTLVMLSRKPDKTTGVVEALISALSQGNLRTGAQATLIKIGPPALELVSLLLDSADTSLIEAAQDILSGMGSIAFPKIYELYQTSKKVENAVKIYRAIPSTEIAVGLTAYLSSNSLLDIEIGIYLLHARIWEEENSGHIVIITEMLNQGLNTNVPHESVRRILAALLLFNGRSLRRKTLASYIVDHLLTHFAAYQNDPKRLELFTRILPFMREQAEIQLIRILDKLEPQNSSLLLQEAVAMLGLITPHRRIVSYADHLAQGKVAGNNQQTIMLHDPLQYRALGGLLASGYYNPKMLTELSSSNRDDNIAYEFYTVLLGNRFKPVIDQLNARLRVANDNLAEANRKIDRQEGKIDQLNQQLHDEQEESARLRRERDSAKREQQATEKNDHETIRNLREQIRGLDQQYAELLQRYRRSQGLH